MLVKSESLSKIPINNFKLNQLLPVYLSVVNGPKICTKNFTRLYLGVSKADKIFAKGGQVSSHL